MSSERLLCVMRDGTQTGYSIKQTDIAGGFIADFVQMNNVVVINESLWIIRVTEVDDNGRRFPGAGTVYRWGDRGTQHRTRTQGGDEEDRDRWSIGKGCDSLLYKVC